MSEKSSFTFAQETELRSPQSKHDHLSLRHCVNLAIADYFADLDGQRCSNLYQMVLQEVEAPLLAAVMELTGENQSRAAEMLGLNRGTLRKKLKEYNLL
jgi:Fis family transcriptional regulator, factor for inversion stimulation protein